MRLLLIACLALCSCATSPNSTESGKKSSRYQEIDSWRLMGKAYLAAAENDAVALHDSFICAYMRLNNPYQGGEDLEAIRDYLDGIQLKIGDSNFADALSSERPEIIAAVGYFIESSSYPKTTAVLKSAPQIDFPYQKSARDQTHPLLERFLARDEG
jgi:hypothetical protein